MNPKHELLTFISFGLLCVGILGLFRDPVFGLFSLPILQSILFIFSGLFFLIFPFQKTEKYSKHFMFLFLLIAVVDLFIRDSYLGFSVATSSFDIFIAGIFGYISFGKVQQTHFPVA